LENERPKVDRRVLDFVKSTVFDPADFSFAATGLAGPIRKWRAGWSQKPFERLRRPNPMTHLALVRQVTE
jgi:hypothetical protein